MSTQPNAYLTPEQYLEIERKAEFKSEYHQGKMFAMAGASPTHARIVLNIGSELNVQLKCRPCEAFVNDLRLRVLPTGLFAYPDVVVVCGEAQFADDQKDTLLNPTLVIEVLSKSTRNYDRGEKFEQYRKLPSLHEYLTVAQDRCHIEHWIRREESLGAFVEYNDPGQTIQLASISCVLSIADIYDKVEWSV